jgi:transposase
LRHRLRQFVIDCADLGTIQSVRPSGTDRLMAHHVRETERRQKLLLPAGMMEWLPEDDIIHLIVEAAAMMDLAKFEASYRLGRAGQAPFAPQVLLALLIYGYSQGVRSNRAIERLCGRDAGYRFIVGDTISDQTVIARFRRHHSAEMKTMLRLCRETGLVRLGLVSLDGTKVQGNASPEANRTAASIEAEIEKILAEAEATDVQEDSHARLPAAQQDAALPKPPAQQAERLARLRKGQEKLERQWLRRKLRCVRLKALQDHGGDDHLPAGERRRGEGQHDNWPHLHTPG